MTVCGERRDTYLEDSVPIKVEVCNRSYGTIIQRKAAVVQH